MKSKAEIRELRRMWRRVDKLQAEIDALDVLSRPLRLRVGRSLGFFLPVGREVLERELDLTQQV